MFHRLRCFAYAFCFALLLIWRPAMAQAAPPILSGVVINSAGQPVGSVSLILQELKIDRQDHRSWQVISETTTDKNGRFDFVSIDPATLHGEAYRVDLATTSRYNQSEFIITDDTNPFAVSRDLNAQGRINGKVTVDNKRPAADVAVSLYRVVTTQEYAFDQLVRRTLTDESGRYSFRNLAPGDYKVGFADAFYPERYVAEYHADSFDSWQATMIHVEDGTTTINAELARAASLAGTVRGPDNEPLGEIAVTAYRFMGEGMGYYLWASSMLTLSDGTYELNGLPAGSYRIGYYDATWPIRYAQKFYTNGATLEEGVDIVVAGGETRTGVDVQLAAAGRINGSVIDEDGAPISDIVVIAYRETTVEGQLSWYEFSSGYTGEDGAYEIGGLPVGEYRIEFIDAMWASRYQNEYYDNVPTIEDATSLPIVEGAMLSGIDATLTRLAQIQGHVTTADNQPLVNAMVLLYQPMEEDEWYPIQQTGTDSDGNYLFGGLLPGDYKVGFAYQWGMAPIVYYQQATSLEAATTIAVTAGATVPAIDGQLPIPGAINGHVSDPNGQPLTGIMVTALYSTTYDGYSYWTESAPVESGADGAYTLTNLPTNHYIVRFADKEWPSRYSLVYYDNTFDLTTATAVDVTNGQTTGGIDIQMAHTGKISGQLFDETGTALENINVAAEQKIVDLAGNEWWNPIAFATTDATGNYTIEGLNVGIYRVGFYDGNWPRHYVTEYYNDVIDGQDAQLITVTAAGHLTGLNAQLATGSQISGWVTNHKGDTVSDLTVVAFRSVIDATGEQQWNYYSEGYLEADGHYAIPALPAGQYRVGFFSWSGLYQELYYNDAADLLSATDIVLDGVQAVDNINATLHPLQAGNAPLVAHNDSATLSTITTQERIQAVGMSVLTNDVSTGTPLKAQLLTDAKHGTVELHTDGSFVYTVGDSAVTIDSFTYQATDGYQTSNQATVFIIMGEPLTLDYRTWLPVVANH